MLSHSPILAHRFGPAIEPATPQVADRTSLFLLVLLHAGLLIPYITHLVPALYSVGLFPLRPAYYMLALCAATSCCALWKGPDLTKTSLFLIALLAARTLDVAILQRFHVPGGQKDAFLSMAAVTLTATATLLSLGALRKSSFLPVLGVAAASLLIQVAAVLLEFTGFYRLSTVPGRAAGLAGDSNDASMMITLMLAVFLTLHRGFWLDITIIAIAALGVLPTLSRGGMLVLFLIAAAYALGNVREHTGKILAAGIALLAMLATMMTVLLSHAGSGGMADENARRRVEAIFRGDLDELQSGERFKDLTDGIDGALQQPLTGLGTGAGQFDYQPHNQLVTMWIELGLLGPLAFLLILTAASWKVVSARGKGIYLLIPLWLYVGLAQTLLDNYAYLYALLVLLVFTTPRLLSLRLARSGAAPGLSPRPPR